MCAKTTVLVSTFLVPKNHLSISIFTWLKVLGTFFQSMHLWRLFSRNAQQTGVGLLMLVMVWWFVFFWFCQFFGYDIFKLCQYSWVLIFWVCGKIWGQFFQVLVFIWWTGYLCFDRGFTCNKKQDKLTPDIKLLLCLTFHYCQG